jgi:hypothetical protein
MDTAFEDLEHDLSEHARDAFDRSIWPVRHAPATVRVVDLRDRAADSRRIPDESLIEID